MRFVLPYSRFNKIDESVEKDKFMVYHRTKYDKPEDFKKGFIVGSGAFHGAGLYTTQDLKGQFSLSMLSTYGPNIVEFEVTNTGKFIYFDFNLYKNTMGGSDYQKGGETKKSYDLISQLKKILGGKFNRVYKASKEKIDDFNKQLYSTQNGERNADIANAIVRLPGILSEVDGIIYTGFVDGNCVLIYNTNLAKAVRWSFVPDEKAWSNVDAIKWNKISENVNKEKFKCHIYKTDKPGILFDESNIGNSVSIVTNKSNRLLAKVVGRIPDGDEWKDFGVAISPDIAKKLNIEEGSDLMIVWRGLTNKASKLENQFKNAEKFLSGFNLLDVLKDEDEDKETYDELLRHFDELGAQKLIINNLALFSTEHENELVKSFLLRWFNSVENPYISLDLLLMLNKFGLNDIIKKCLLSKKEVDKELMGIIINEDLNGYGIDFKIEEILNREELIDFYKKSINTIMKMQSELKMDKLVEKYPELIDVIKQELISDSNIAIQKANVDYLTKGKSDTFLGKLFKQIIDDNPKIIIKLSESWGIFERIFPSKSRLSDEYSIDNSNINLDEKVKLEILKNLRDKITEQITAKSFYGGSNYDYCISTDNPDIRKYRKSILKPAFEIFFDGKSDITWKNFENFFSVYYNSDTIFDTIKSWFTNGQLRLEKELKWNTNLIESLLRDIQNTLNQDDYNEKVFLSFNPGSNSGSTETNQLKDFANKFLEFIFNIKEFELNLFYKNPNEMFQLAVSNKLLGNFKEAYDKYEEDLKKQEEEKRKADELKYQIKLKEEAVREVEVDKILETSFKDMINYLYDKRLIILNRIPKWNSLYELDIFSRNINYSNIQKWNQILISLQEELKNYVLNGEIKSKYTDAQNISDVINSYVKDLEFIKAATTGLIYKFKDFIHKII